MSAGLTAMKANQSEHGLTSEANSPLSAVVEELAPIANPVCDNTFNTARKCVRDSNEGLQGAHVYVPEHLLHQTHEEPLRSSFSAHPRVRHAD